MVTYGDVQDARGRIAKYLAPTPLDVSLNLGDETSNVYWKLECQQKQKSFKVRGALSKMTWLGRDALAKGVYAISSGNHGAGVSYAAHLLGVENARVYVPKAAPKAKVDKIAWYGATVVQVGQNYDEAHRAAEEEMRGSGLTFISPGDDVQVAAGQGTIGLEILEQNPDIDVILVPIGGGGMITGIATAAKHIKPGIQVIGVQTAACPAMVASLRDGVYYEEFPSEGTLCDALVGGVFRLAFDMAKQCIDDVIVVEEADIAKAAAFMLAEEKIVAEPSSAVGAAAYRQNRVRFKGKNTAVVVSGGNLDADLMQRLLNG